MGLAITSMPLNIPELGAFVRVPHAVSLRCLVAKAGGVRPQVANLFADPITLGESRIDLLPSNGVLRWFLLNGRLAHPNVERRRYFADKRKPSTIKPIEKVPVSTVVFVERPRFDADAILSRLVNQLQSNLAFGEKLNVSWDVCFFRRDLSSSHSFGRYICAAIRHWNVFVANEAATLTTAFSILPRLPLY